MGDLAAQSYRKWLIPERNECQPQDGIDGIRKVL
jgi:hypothetical protein